MSADWVDTLTPEMFAKFTELYRVSQMWKAEETARGRFTEEQYDQLLRPIDPKRVLVANRQSHVSQQDVRAHLNRIFGFEAWDKEIRELRLVRDGVKKNNDGKEVPAVTYLCVMRLTIRDSQGRFVKFSDDVGTGTSPNLPDYGGAHDFASKNAVSYALKRCAIDLGDQFGLSLYNKGQLEALVRGSFGDPRRQQVPSGDVQDGVPQQVSMGDTEGGVDTETGEIAPAPQARVQQDRAAEGRTRQIGQNGNGTRPVQRAQQSQPATVAEPEVPNGTNVNEWKNYLLAVAVYSDPARYRKDDGKANVPNVATEYTRFMRGGALKDATIEDIKVFAAHLLTGAVMAGRHTVGNTPAGVAA